MSMCIAQHALKYVTGDNGMQLNKLICSEIPPKTQNNLGQLCQILNARWMNHFYQLIHKFHVLVHSHLSIVISVYTHKFLSAQLSTMQI